MATFSTYNTQIESKIASTSETFYTSETKVQAVNDTITEILKEYDVPEMIKRAEITFDSDGLASKPDDYVRMIKLWESDSNDVETAEYMYIAPDKFDLKASTEAYYWTEDYVVADAERKLKILPIASGTVDIRYIISPETVDTEGATDSGLSDTWNEAIAYGASMRLFQMSNRWDEAREYGRLYEKALRDAYLSVKNPGGIKQNNRFKSRFERQSLLNR